MLSVGKLLYHTDLNYRASLHTIISLTQSDQHASMAQLDACPTDDQEVAGLIPLGLATFFHGD